MDIAIQLFLNGLLTASFYALVASGLALVYATSKIFHLAHGVVIVAAGYLFWWLTRVGHAPVTVSLVASVLAAGLIGLAMNELVYEPLRRRGTRGLGYLIATLALLLLGTGLILLLFGAAPRTFALPSRVLELGSVRLTLLQLGILATTAVLLAAAYVIQRHTRLGKAMRATADHSVVAEVLGINTRSVRRAVFFLTALWAAPAGILLGLEFNLDPNQGILLAVLGYASLVIGGVGRFAGPLVGALVLGQAEQLAVWYGGAGWKHAIAFILLFVFLLVRPHGIVGETSRAS